MHMNEKNCVIDLREDIRDKILSYISRMNFSYGTKLLSEKQLAAKFLVSRGTIRTVLSELETEGKLIRKQGSGTYVNTKAFMLETTLYPRIDMRTIIEKNGFAVSSHNLSVKHAPAGEFSKYLNCNAGDEIQEVHSIYYADRQPCMYCVDRIPSGILSDECWKGTKMHARSLYTSFRDQADIHITWDVIRIYSVCCSDVPQAASYLKKGDAPNKSLTLLTIINYDENSRPILYGNIYVNTDLIQLNLIRDLSKLP